MRRRVVVRALIAVAAIVILLTAIAQLVLPPLASEAVRDKLGRYGTVQSVSISAWPALTLLWHSADSLDVRASRLALSPARSVQLLAEGSGIDRLDAGVASLREGPLELRAVVVRKRGGAIAAEGLTDRASLAAALPGDGLALVASAGGALRVSVDGAPFARRGRLAAVVRPLGHSLVLEVPGLPTRLTLFSDSRLDLLAVGFSKEAGGVYRVSLRARLR